MRFMAWRLYRWSWFQSSGCLAEKNLFGRVEVKVLIIGGGIGGLTTALSLNQAGLHCEVFEAVDEVRPLGVGINLLPHAVRELTELGLQGALAESAIETESLMYMNKFGQEIWKEARGTFSGYSWPQYSIHRGELQMILHQAVLERIGADKIHTGHKLVDFDQDSEGVTAVFEVGATNDQQIVKIDGDVLIAADGIHSCVRRIFYPDEGPPIWNGCLLWRATTVGPPYLDGRTMIMAGHANQKFVCYPISKAHSDEGRSLINWIAEIRHDPSETWDREDWNRLGKIEDFLPSFDG